MKISQIKTLGHGGSCLSAILFGVLTFHTISALKTTEPTQPFSWPPHSKKIPSERYEGLLSPQEIRRSLSFLTDRPLATPTRDTSSEKNKAQQGGPIIPAKPYANFFVTSIAFDDFGSEHLAFIKRGFHPSHPYSERDIISSSPASRVSRIFRDHVVIRNDKGHSHRLFLRNDGQRLGGKNTLNHPVSNAHQPGSSGGLLPKEKSNPSKNSMNDQNNIRYVPTWRKTTCNENYGVSVVEFSPTPSGIRRFGTSLKDLEILQKQSLRLLGEVLPMTAYGEDGKAIGIRMNFANDEALLSQYGIKDGDILTQFNGKSVSDEQQALELYNELDGKKRSVMVTLERGGTPFNLILEMDDFPNVRERK